MMPHQEALDKFIPELTRLGVQLLAKFKASGKSRVDYPKHGFTVVLESTDEKSFSFHFDTTALRNDPHVDPRMFAFELKGSPLKAVSFCSNEETPIINSLLLVDTGALQQAINDFPNEEPAMDDKMVIIDNGRMDIIKDLAIKLAYLFIRHNYGVITAPSTIGAVLKFDQTGDTFILTCAHTKRPHDLADTEIFKIVIDVASGTISNFEQNDPKQNVELLLAAFLAGINKQATETWKSIDPDIGTIADLTRRVYDRMLKLGVAAATAEHYPNWILTRNQSEVLLGLTCLTRDTKNIVFKVTYSIVDTTQRFADITGNPENIQVRVVLQHFLEKLEQLVNEQFETPLTEKEPVTMDAEENKESSKHISEYLRSIPDKVFVSWYGSCLDIMPAGADLIPPGFPNASNRNVSPIGPDNYRLVQNEVLRRLNRPSLNENMLAIDLGVARPVDVLAAYKDFNEELLRFIAAGPAEPSVRDESYTNTTELFLSQEWVVWYRRKNSCTFREAWAEGARRLVTESSSRKLSQVQWFPAPENPLHVIVTDIIQY